MEFKEVIKDVLRPAYYVYCDIFDFAGRRRLAKNGVLKDRYAGKRIFLLLTGESLARIDITQLKDEYTFGGGFIFLHKDILDLGLDFYVDIDSPKVFRKGVVQWPQEYLGPLSDNGIEDFYRAIDKHLDTRTILFLNSDNYRHIEKGGFFKNKTTHFLKGRHYLNADQRKKYTELADLTKRRVSGSSAVFYSIFISMYMGFKEIYLCGAGYTYEPAYECHFYDNVVYPKNIGYEKAEIQAREKIEKSFPGLAYRGLVEQGEFYRAVCGPKQDYAYYHEWHRQMNDYAVSQGVKIYNVVPDGFESPVYEKVSFDEVLKKQAYQETVGV